jgi:hypothetical protein
MPMRRYWRRLPGAHTSFQGAIKAEIHGMCWFFILLALGLGIMLASCDEDRNGPSYPNLRAAPPKFP